MVNWDMQLLPAVSPILNHFYICIRLVRQHIELEAGEEFVRALTVAKIQASQTGMIMQEGESEFLDKRRGLRKLKGNSMKSGSSYRLLTVDKRIRLTQVSKLDQQLK